MSCRGAHLDTLRERDRARELAEAALADSPAVLVLVLLELGLARDGERVLVHVDVDVLLRQTRKLEGRSDKVLLLVLVDVNSECRCQ